MSNLSKNFIRVTKIPNKQKCENASKSCAVVLIKMLTYQPFVIYFLFSELNVAITDALVIHNYDTFLPFLQRHT